jgi:hypothetical protein
MRMEPPVSEPSAIGTMPAATAAPDPPLEPPGTRAISHCVYRKPYPSLSNDRIG